ncbi:MAG: hypothetical protein ACM3SY_17565 [Candidatus Omnitrophota bacterium]
MKRQQGKVTLTGLLLIVIIVYGAFVAIKFASVTIDSTQLKKDISDRIGLSRGPDFTLEDGQKIIREILVQKRIIAADERIAVEGEENENPPGGDSDAPQTPPRVTIAVRFDDNKTKIKFFVKYDEELNLILFKRKQTVTVEDQIINLN